MQSILRDVERFQSEVTSALAAEQLDASKVQELLSSEVIVKIDLPEHNELQRVSLALFLTK